MRRKASLPFALTALILTSWAPAAAQQVVGVEHGGIKLYVWEKYVGSQSGKKVVVLAHGSATAGKESFDLQVPGKPSFRQGLRELGYVEGQNITLEFPSVEVVRRSGLTSIDKSGKIIWRKRHDSNYGSKIFFHHGRSDFSHYCLAPCTSDSLWVGGSNWRFEGANVGKLDRACDFCLPIIRRFEPRQEDVRRSEVK